MKKKQKKLYNFTGCCLCFVGSDRWEKIDFVAGFIFGKGIMRRILGMKKHAFFVEVESQHFFELLLLLAKRNDRLISKNIFLWKMYREGKCINIDYENVVYSQSVLGRSGSLSLFNFAFFLKVFFSNLVFFLNKIILSLLQVLKLKKKC